MAPLKSKENFPPRRNSAMLSLSPSMKAAEELLSENKEYKALLSMKDQYDVFFFLCRTSPEICVADAQKFLFRFLDHYLRRVISNEIAESKATDGDFLGPEPMPFQEAWQVQYISYLSWNDQMMEGDEKRNHELILYRAEILLKRHLTANGYNFSPEQLPFSHWIRNVAKASYAVDRRELNVVAHLFTDLLQFERTQGFNTPFTDLPPPQAAVISDEYELGRKVFALEYLKSKQGKMDRYEVDAYRAAYFLIETYMAKQVEQSREVLYGESQAMIPGKLAANQIALRL